MQGDRRLRHYDRRCRLRPLKDSGVPPSPSRFAVCIGATARPVTAGGYSWWHCGDARRRKSESRPNLIGVGARSCKRWAWFQAFERTPAPANFRTGDLGATTMSAWARRVEDGPIAGLVGSQVDAEAWFGLGAAVFL